MEVVEALKQNIGMLLLTVIGGAGVIALAMAAWTTMMAHGDAQQMAKARNAFMGGIFGLMIGGFAFAIPELISETVVVPSGGRGFGNAEAGSCDDRLRRELILQPNANTTARMNQVIRIIQTREDACLSDNWDPLVVSGDSTAFVASSSAFFASDVRSDCFETGEWGTGPYTVDELSVPSRLLVEQGVKTVPSIASVRGVNDNILIYFDAARQPTDLARCWMYLARDRLWVGS